MNSGKQTNEDTQNSKSKQPHTEPLEPNLDHENTHEYDKNPTEPDPKHTDKSDTKEFETIKQGCRNKNLEPNAEELEEPEDEVHFPTPFIDKIL